MARVKKRPSKNAKAAQKIVNNSKLLADIKAVKNSNTGSELKPKATLLKTADANKLRPQKKRG